MFTVRLTAGMCTLLLMAMTLVGIQVALPPTAAVGAPVPSAGHATSIKALALNLADVRQVYGSGFKDTRTASVLTKGRAPTLYARHGFVVGYSDAFMKLTRLYEIRVVSGVNEFKDARGSRWLLGISRGAPGFKPLKGVGDQAFVYNVKALRAIGTIVFRRGAFVSSVSVSAPNAVSQSRVLALARLMDRRIQRRG